MKRLLICGLIFLCGCTYISVDLGESDNAALAIQLERGKGKPAIRRITKVDSGLKEKVKEAVKEKVE